MPSISAAQLTGTGWAPFPLPVTAAQALPSGFCINGAAGLIQAVYTGTDGYVYFNMFSRQWFGQVQVSDSGDPVPDGAPSVALIPGGGGAVACVYPHNGTLYCATADNPREKWRPPTAIGNWYIASGTSPALITYNGVLYCVYQHAEGNAGSGGDGQLCWMTFNTADYTWTQVELNAADYYGITGSPSIATTELADAAYVMYQGYGTSGALTASAITPNGFQQFFLNMQPIGMSIPYMSGSAAVAAMVDDMWVAMAGQGDAAGTISVLKFKGPKWGIPSPTTTMSAGTSPTLIAYGHGLVCFWFTG
jgi:hypothetical protein